MIDGPQSIVVEQAENRLHMQKALMAGLVLGNVQRKASAPPAGIPAGVPQR